MNRYGDAMRLLEPINLKSDRLALREPCEADLGSIVELANNYDVAVRLAELPHPYTEADGRWFLEKIVPTRTTWAIVTQQDFIGIIGLRSHGGEEPTVLGYWLGQPYWGHGYATEAGRLVVEYCKQAPGLKKINSGYFADNVASGRVLMKLGFEEYGRQMRYQPVLDKEIEHVDVQLNLNSFG